MFKAKAVILISSRYSFPAHLLNVTSLLLFSLSCCDSQASLAAFLPLPLTSLQLPGPPAWSLGAVHLFPFSLLRCWAQAFVISHMCCHWAFVLVPLSSVCLGVRNLPLWRCFSGFLLSNPAFGVVHVQADLLSLPYILTLLIEPMGTPPSYVLRVLAHVPTSL